MPQSVKGNHRQFVGFVLVGVVVAQKILQGTVGRVVAHHGVVPVPIGPDFLTAAGLLIFLHQQIQTSPQQSHGILLQYP